MGPGPVADWLMEGQLQKMVLVVTSVATKEVLERWTFDIHTDRAAAGGGRAPPFRMSPTVSLPVLASMPRLHLGTSAADAAP